MAATQRPDPERTTPRDLQAEFGARDVTAAFNAIHAFLQTCTGPASRDRILSRIHTGDWLDLPRLTVQADAGGGAVTAANIDLGANGTLLRRIVVGVDSFAGTTADAPAHVVFQFQNLPVTHRMNPTNSNEGGYAASEMRRYLTGNFLSGLLAAGLPESVIYAPTRSIANGGRYAGAADALADKVWLPTEREMAENGQTEYDSGCYGPFSSGAYETPVNQARLEYYTANAGRQKRGASNNNTWYWLASPYSDSESAAYFCIIHHYGFTHYGSASTVGGCAPAFCVK
jgi:hypothetical protein